MILIATGLQKGDCTMKKTNYINNLSIIQKVLDNRTTDEKNKMMQKIINKNIEISNKKQLTL
jgi:hypothetical protein